MNKKIIKAAEYLLVLISIIVIWSLFVVENATALVWTVLLPLLPLTFLIIGFSHWRDICPLAFFSKISQNITLFKKRKVPEFFERNFYLIQFSLLGFGFYLRHVVINFDDVALGIFFVAVIALAFLTNLVFTGKTWCNFFCPVGVVEKIYCGSNSHQYDHNSACSACSACKRDCPDIDMESNYWKEAGNKQKTNVFYAFPGLVLGFYFYFFLQSGSFEGYFAGTWTTQVLELKDAGFFFAPSIPVFIAAAVTLMGFAYASYFIFKLIEIGIARNFRLDISYKTYHHRMRMVAGFIAFNIFYVFAGAPSYSQEPEFYAVLYFGVVFLSTITLHKEFFREESYFIQERFALKMLKSGKSNKVKSKNLQEIYYTYINANRDKKESLRTYKETISELLLEGVLTQESLSVLEKLREQMGISYDEHEMVMKNIKATNADLFSKDMSRSAETRYQRESYKKILAEELEKHTSVGVAFIDDMKKQFGITKEVHQEILNEILNANENLYKEIMDLLKKMNLLRRAHKSILNDNSHEIHFLKYVIRNEFNLVTKELFVLLDLMYKDEKEHIALIKENLKYKNLRKKMDVNVENLSFIDPKILKSLIKLKQDFDSNKDVYKSSDNKPIIKYLLEMDSVYIPVAALLVARTFGDDFIAEIDLDKFLKSRDKDAMALAQKIKMKSNGITIYERMMYLYHVPLFEGIKFNEFKQLAQSTMYREFQNYEYVIKQGEVGKALYIVVSGNAVIEKDNQVVSHVGRDQYFGAVALLGDIKRTVSVRGVNHLKTLVLSKDAFKKFILDNPKISIKLMKEIIQKLMNDKECELLNNIEDK